MVGSWLMSFAVSLVVLGLGMSVEAPACITLGCKAAMFIPPPTSCAHTYVDFTIVIDGGTSITHGFCGCPGGVCTEVKDTCSISGARVRVDVKPAHAAAVDITVGGVNFGNSFTWSPGDPISGCGNSNFEIISLTGVAGGCMFIFGLECRACSFAC